MGTDLTVDHILFNLNTAEHKQREMKQNCKQNAKKKRSADPWHPVSQKPAKKMKTQKKPKKKKGFSFMKAAFDVIEDMFDEILD